MRYSLINVACERDGLIDGNWVQDCTGTLIDAIKRARETERVNSYRITVAVVEGVNSTAPMLSYYHDLERLD